MTFEIEIRSDSGWVLFQIGNFTVVDIQNWYGNWTDVVLLGKRMIGTA